MSGFLFSPEFSPSDQGTEKEQLAGTGDPEKGITAAKQIHILAKCFFLLLFLLTVRVKMG